MDHHNDELRPHVAVDIEAEAPPPFTPYTPEFFLSSHGDTISHDHHINQDGIIFTLSHPTCYSIPTTGEALFRFLLAQSRIPPTFLLSIRGTHNEHRTRTVSTRDANGRLTTRTEHYTVTVTDFSFTCDLTPYIVHGPVFWSVPDAVPAYRGEMVRQVMLDTGGKRKSTREEKHTVKDAEDVRWEMGAPPWQDLSNPSVPVNRQASTKTPRQWADEYAASPKILKEFVYEKFVYGWSTTKLESAITTLLSSSLASASSAHPITVSAKFQLSANKIIIRPDNRLSRLLSSTLWKVLLCITLVYPVIWLFKRFGRGRLGLGGRWEVGGAAYGMWTEVDDNKTDSKSEPSTTIHPSEITLQPPFIDPSHPMHMSRLVPSPNSSEPKEIRGYREGEWFREWEPVILKCAATRLIQGTNDPPLRRVQDIFGGVAMVPAPVMALEGYTPEEQI